MRFICKYLLVLILSLTTVHAEPTVVVTIRPLHSITSNVMSGIAEPVLLIDKIVSAHHYALTPQNRLQLEQAHLIIWVGDAIETSLAKLLNNAKLSSKVYSALSADNLRLHPWRSTETDHHGDHNHAAEIDQHIWLDSHNAAAIANAIAIRLSNNDPSNKQRYMHNANVFIEKLAKLNRQLDQQLAVVADKPFMVSHDAFQYFDRQFRLNYQGDLTINPRLPLSGKQWLKLQQELQQKQPVCIFYDPSYSPRLAKQLNSNTQLEALDPIGYQLELGERLYFELMENIGNRIVNCLQDKHP